MKNQALFSSNDKSKKLKCRLLQFLFGALRVNAAKTKTVEIANSIEPDEAAHNKPPHLDLHYLPHYHWILNMISLGQHVFLNFANPAFWQFKGFIICNILVTEKPRF